MRIYVYIFPEVWKCCTTLHLLHKIKSLDLIIIWNRTVFDVFSSDMRDFALTLYVSRESARLWRLWPFCAPNSCARWCNVIAPFIARYAPVLLFHIIIVICNWKLYARASLRHRVLEAPTRQFHKRFSRGGLGRSPRENFVFLALT